MNFRVVTRTDKYEIREVEVVLSLCYFYSYSLFKPGLILKVVTLKQPYYVAETTMPGKAGFDFYGASKSFNVLAEYLFGKVLCISITYEFCIHFSFM